MKPEVNYENMSLHGFVKHVMISINILCYSLDDLSTKVIIGM